MDYLFKSTRLGFRNWRTEDVEPFAKINADKEVMLHFPKTLTKKETEGFIAKSQQQFSEKGFTYFAVDILETKQFIGFIGLSYQTYEAPFNPSVDIGWRLDKAYWGNGYATEGAQKCLEFAKNVLRLTTINSVCTQSNKASENVMQKIGMQKVSSFLHPMLQDYPSLQECLHYQIKL